MGKTAELRKVGPREKHKGSREPWCWPPPRERRLSSGHVSLPEWTLLIFSNPPGREPDHGICLTPFPETLASSLGFIDFGREVLCCFTVLMPIFHRRKLGVKVPRIDSARKAFGARQWEKTNL